VSSGRRIVVIVGVVVLALLVAGVWMAVVVELDSDDPPRARGAENRYRVVDRLCEQVDLRPVFAVRPASGDDLRENVVQSGDATLRDCMLTLGPGGSLWITMGVHGNPELALRRYEGDLRGGTIATNSNTTENARGPWQEGVVGLGIRGFAAGAEVCVRDANLTVCVEVRVSAVPNRPAPTNDDVAAAVVRVAEDVVARSRR